MKPRARPDWLILLGLVLLGGIIGQVQNRARNEGRMDFLTSFTHRILQPAASGFAATTRTLTDFSTGLINADELSRENERLRAQIASVQLYEERLHDWQTRHDNLRETIELSREISGNPLFADVTAISQFENRITINRGENDGVRRGLAVVHAGALLGVVENVSDRNAQVLLITSPHQQVGGMTFFEDPTENVVGLVRGVSPVRLVFDIIDTRNPLQIGDKVVTSGLGENIPRGIRIGRVTAIGDDPEFGSVRAFLAPTVRLQEVREVAVIR